MRQKIHGEMHAIELAAGNGKVARRLGAARKQHRIVGRSQLLDAQIDPDIHIVVEDDAFGLHLLDATVDMTLLHLEVGNAISQKAAGLCVLLVKMHTVAGAAELLRAAMPGGAGAHDGYRLVGLAARWLRNDPALLKSAVNDRAFNRLDRHRLVVEIKRAGGLAGRWTNAAGEFREVVGRVKIGEPRFQSPSIGKVVPVGDLVVDRTADVTNGMPQFMQRAA